MTFRTGDGVGSVGAAGGAGARSAAAPHGGATLPRAVTRGESQTEGATVKVDWLNATFARPATSIEGWTGFLSRIIGRPVVGAEGRGMFGFQTAVRLRAYLGGSLVDIGYLAFGGDSQRGRMMMQLTGRGCGLVQDWPSLHAFLGDLEEVRITRCDLAADFMDGEYTVDDAVRLHKEGGFTGAGRPPTTETAGDWLDGIRGRTLYVGKGSNGKMLRVYEKGIQLGDLGSPWVRYEVQLGNRDREIPLDVLLRPREFFAGCYPCLASMVEEAAEKIKTTRTEGETSLSRLVFHAKRTYGKLFDALSKLTGADHAELVEEVRVVGIPRRLNPSGLAAGVTWADVQARARKQL